MNGQALRLMLSTAVRVFLNSMAPFLLSVPPRTRLAPVMHGPRCLLSPSSLLAARLMLTG